MSDSKIERAPIAEIPGLGEYAKPEKHPWYGWGQVTWLVDFADPETSLNVPPKLFHGLIRLMPCGGEMEQSIDDVEWYANGDSDYDMPEGERGDLTLHIGTPQGDADVRISPIKNKHGRLGGFAMLAEVKRHIDAYRAFQNAFNSLLMHFTYKRDVPLRQSAILVFDDEKRVARFLIGYPKPPMAEDFDIPPLASRIVALYTEGVRSNSPLYAFLCYFSIVEFLIGPWQGVTRKLGLKYGVTVTDLRGSLVAIEVLQIHPWSKGKSYNDLLKEHRTFRNYIAHFIFGRGPRPLMAKAEDDIAAARDLFRVACKDLIAKTMANFEAFTKVGIDSSSLESEIDDMLSAKQQRGQKKTAGKN